MKKLLVLPLLFLGLSQAQFVTKSAGVKNHTRVYVNATGDTIFTDLDTTAASGGLKINHIQVSGSVKADTINVNSSASTLLPDGSANFANNAFLVKPNGSMVGDSIFGAFGVYSGAITMYGSPLATYSTAKTWLTDTAFNNALATTISGTLPNVNAVMGIMAASEPTLTTYVTAGSSDTIPFTDWVRGLITNNRYAPNYSSATTYDTNAVVSYCTTGCDSVYVSNVGSNLNHTPSISPTQWTGYAYPGAIDTYILKHAVFSH